MANPDSYCWHNGDLTSSDHAFIPIADRGFLLGDGLFETIWINQGVPVFWHNHLQRLRTSADCLALPIPYTDEALLAALMSVIEKTGIKAYGSARLTVTRGAGARGLAPPLLENTKPQILITAIAGQAPVMAPLSYTVAETRRNEGSFASQMKMVSYADNILARQEALEVMADEAIMLNNQGMLTCGTIGNIFQLQEERLITPALECGVLPGIVRSHILGAAVELGFSVEEQEMLPATLGAGLWFVSNSLMGLRCLYPVGSDFVADDVDLKSFQSILNSYQSMVMQDISQFKIEQSI